MEDRVMKYLLLFVVGVLQACAPDETGEVEIAELVHEKRTLHAEITNLYAIPVAVDVHSHWQFVFEWFGKHQGMTINPATTEPGSVTDTYGGVWWGGVVSGPAMEVLIAARQVQSVVPIFFTRFSGSNRQANLFFYVLGAGQAVDA